MGLNERAHGLSIFWGLFIQQTLCCSYAHAVSTCSALLCYAMLCSALQLSAFPYYRFVAFSANLIQSSLFSFLGLRSLGDTHPSSSFVRWLTKKALQFKAYQYPSSNMENNKRLVGSSSSPMNFDHLFGPKDSSSTSTSSTSIFGSIFPPSSTVGGRDSRKHDVGCKNYGAPGNHSNRGESSGGISNRNTSTNYQNETMEPSYFSSSIYYGGQENYSPRTRTSESYPIFKKDTDDDDPNGNNSNSASRGNWWQGSLYY